ncbi:MAG: GNAT family N-acetyltransferase [Gammaproteobacteria bacterium]|nr:GNAT family N-acetyltransferase [Gammaproteobacteria bacterium]
MKINFHSFQTEHIPLWEKWITIPHVKNVWFIEGYEPADYIYQKIKGNGYEFPYVIYLDNQPIGYIVCCDLYAYKTLCPKPKGLFTDENKGTFCMDLFIADEDKLNQGLGTKIVKQFTDFIFDRYKAKVILIDPASTNKRAIRCYEKAGFHFVKEAFDGVTMCTIMRKIK